MSKTPNEWATGTSINLSAMAQTLLQLLSVRLCHLMSLTVCIQYKPVEADTKKEDKNGLQDRISVNAGQMYCRMSGRLRQVLLYFKRPVVQISQNFNM